MILMIGLFGAIFLGLFAIFFPAYYISELILSFLPYMLVLSFVGFMVNIILLRNKSFRKSRYVKYLKIVPLFVLLFGLLFFLSSRQYNNFYTGQGFDGDSMTGNTQGFDILYSNILYTNDDYTGLNDMIIRYDPDMVFMVEFTDKHNQFFKNKLKLKYPYSARTRGSEKYFGGVVFSKRPIQNLTSKIDQGAWRYSYFKTNYNGDDYYIYLIHTSSPVAYRYFEMRNKQFDIIANDYISHKNNRSGSNKVIMLGDFNVSPWSSYYKAFADKLLGLVNITSKFSYLFTWYVSFLPFIQSHIDHIFMTDDILVGDVENIKTPGSDHAGFYIQNIR